PSRPARVQRCAPRDARRRRRAPARSREPGSISWRGIVAVAWRPGQVVSSWNAPEVPMAGHSKWKQIKRKKAVTDARRGALFTKLIREITIAAKQGGGDPGGNARLRTAIDAAKAENMPLDNIERAVKKGTGELEGVQYVEVAYEGYGPGGAAIFIEATTDNANRTVAEIRHVFTRHRGNLAAANSVAWMFDRKGQITVDATTADEDATMEAALEAGADDMVRDGDLFLITGPVSQLHAIQEKLKARRIPVQSAEIAMIPKSTV